MLLPLDGPSKQYSLTVGTSTVLEVLKPTESVLEERKVVTIQPLDQSIYVYFGDGSGTPSPAVMAADGFFHFKKAKETYEAADSQEIYILSVNGSGSVIIAERA